jgi:integrin beta 8
VPAQPGGRRTTAIVLVVAAVVLLALVSTVTAGLLVRSRSSASYPIGSCVAHTGSKPHRVSCDTAGAFRVTSKVDDAAQCPADVPHIEVDHSPRNTIYCLQPAGS